MITIQEAKENIGREVFYKAFDGAKPEYGHIFSVNDKNIFVNFGSRTPNRGEACRPASLYFSMR